MAKMRKIIGPLVAALMLLLCWLAPAAATYAVPASNTGEGTIQAVDASQHTITVNGQTLVVSPQAAISGADGFSGLAPGMTVQYMANTPLASGSAVLTVVVVVQAPSSNR